MSGRAFFPQAGVAPIPDDFSVIVPAYNRETLIDHTLAAIFSQDHPPAEVIVVDDGSTDATAGRVATWPGCTLISVPNAGAANARHVGVLASKGSWIAFCDSDDLWRPSHLSRIAAAIRRRPEVGFIFTNFSYFSGDDWKSGTKFDEAPAGYWDRFTSAGPDLLIATCAVLDEILRFQPIFPSCTAMSRGFYDAVGGYDARFGRLPSEDLEFTLRCVMAPPIGAVTEPTAGIRRHEGNHSADLIKQIWGEVEILAHSVSAHGPNDAQRRALRASIGERAAQGIDGAFAARRWTLLRSLVTKLPRDRYSGRRAIKIAIGLLASLTDREKLPSR